MAKKKRYNKLAILGESIANIDRFIVKLVARRLRMAEDVARCKMKIGQPLIRIEVEKARRAKWIAWSREEEMNPELGRMLYNDILGEMLRLEIEVVQSAKKEYPQK